jgi:HK97 family phage portal protein
MAKTKQTTKSNAKSSTLSRLWDMGLDLNSGAASRPTQPFSQSEWVFICVDVIVKTCRSIQMMLSTGADDIVESGPAYDLLLNNRQMPLTQFITETAGYLSLYRECYWVFADKDIETPTRILVCGPDQITPQIVNGVLTGYLMILSDGRPTPLFIDDVWPIIDFNPAKDMRGVGPATAGKLAISAAYQAALFNEATLVNGGKLSGLITLPAGVKLDEDERRALIAQFESRHKGARNAGKWALMTGGADVKPLAQTLADLQMNDLRKFDATTICSLFGVPPEIVGLSTEAQFAHGPAQQRFLLNTIAPMLAYIAEQITLGILYRFRFKKNLHRSARPADAATYFGRCQSFKRLASFRTAAVKAAGMAADLFAWFAIEDHPTLQELSRSRTDQVLKYRDHGIPLNAIIDAYDLPFERQPWGDDWWIQPSLMPARWIQEGGAEMLTGPSLPEGKTDDSNEPAAAAPAPAAAAEPLEKSIEKSDARKRIWKSWVNSFQPLERDYNAALRTYFVRQQRVVLDNLKAALNGIQKAIKSPDIVIRVQFDLVRENGKLKMLHKTFFDRGINLGAAQSISEIQGASGDALKEAVKTAVNTPAVRSTLATSLLHIESVNRTTQKQIGKALTEGLAKEEGLPELTERIKDIYGSKGNLPKAMRIARTETAAAVSAGRHEGFKAAGVELKGWLTSRDNLVRPEHRQAEADYAAGIPLDQPFRIANEWLRYPGDPAASAGNRVNCRCMVTSIRAAGKATPIEAIQSFITDSQTKSWSNPNA